MTNDQYLNLLLLKYAVDENAAKLASQRVMSLINQWGNENIVKTVYSGSIAKGTAINLGTDADIFISLSSKTPGTLQTIYNSLYDTLNRAGYRARIQNVSIGVKINNQKIDIVPARRHDQYTNDHSLYKSKTKTWTKTDI